MFAVIKTGGKQYKVATDDVITIEKLAGEAGSNIVFDTVLMLVNEAGTQVGAPTIAGAVVTGEVVEQTRSKKSISFVKRRRQNSKRKKGHRQELTVVRIVALGASAGEAKPKKAAKPKAPKAEVSAEAAA
jgi:large subunit ribosomal protein L21